MARPPLSVEEREQGALLGQVLQQARADQSKSQSQLANDAGVGVDTLRRIEQGQVANPGVFTVAAIAAALGRPLSQFVTARRRQ